jgi:hypothetical protein
MATRFGAGTHYWSEEAVSAFFFVGPISVLCLPIYLILSGCAGRLKRPSTWIVVAAWLLLAALALAIGDARENATVGPALEEGRSNGG